MKKLIGKLLGAKSGKSVETKQMATPDISRVIKMPAAPPVTAAEIPAPAPEPELAPETADPNELADRAEAAVDAMASQFDAWMEADLHRLMDAWQEAKQPGATPEAYRTVFMCAHNIRGAAGSYGYPAISRRECCAHKPAHRGLPGSLHRRGQRRHVAVDGRCRVRCPGAKRGRQGRSQIVRHSRGTTVRPFARSRPLPV